MKQFIVKILVIVLLVFSTIIALFSLDKPSEIKKLSKLQKGLEIINLGTSHGWDFDYSHCRLNGTNFNLSGNTIYYDLQNYRYLNKKEYLADEAIIIIPVSYFVLGLDENRSDRLPDDSFVNQFYNYLPPWSIYSFSLQKLVDIKLYKVQENFHELITVEPKRKPQKKKKNKHKKTLEEKLKYLEEHANYRVKHHKKLRKFSPELKNIQYLESLISEIKAANQHVVLVTTPYYIAYSRNFGKDWLDQEYFSYMKKIASKYDVLYLDYSYDERFLHEPELFGDSDHLNAEGREIFNKIFFNDIDTLIQNYRSKKSTKS